MTEQHILNRLQPHTISIYSLADQNCIVEKVKARSLLTLDRFDLFAKLYYIQQREDGKLTEAREVYDKHIVAFNPDRKEPGREDKSSVEDFVSAFDSLIEQFRTEGFDDTISLIPVSEGGSILDGAHRVAALAYFDRDVTIARFKGVHPKCKFDYRYFLDRGLSWATADTIAHTMAHWADNLHVACLWPKMGAESEKQKAIKYLASRYPIIFEKRMTLSLKSLMAFVARVYDSQPWVTDSKNVQYKALECFGSNHEVHFVFFQGNGLDQVLADKDAIRNIFQCGKHALHITDNDEETRIVADMLLTQEGLNSWYESSASAAMKERIRERWYYFKKVQWINFKVIVASIINKFRK